MSKITLYMAAIIDNCDQIGAVCPSGDGSEVLTNILNLVYFWGGVLAVIVIIVAGLFFTTSHGDPQLISRAKQAITGAVIGLVVILLAFVITNFVVGIF